MDLLTINEVADKLGVSSATIRNWIKLDKIQYIDDNKRKKFDPKYIEKLKIELFNNNNKQLKSRRNKKFLKGNFFYDSYIDGCDDQQLVIKSILQIIEEQQIELNKNNIQIILANYAISTYLSVNNKLYDSECYLKDFLEKKLNLEIFEEYIGDFIENKTKTIEFIMEYPELFNKELGYVSGQDILGLLYISLHNLKERKNKGAYYTPNKVVNKLLSQISFTNKEFILDPCCGTGNFLLQLPDTIPFNNIYGNDIDKISIKITRINLFLKYNCAIKFKNMKQHITDKDFLMDMDLNSYHVKFDYIIGNPPWGGELSEDQLFILNMSYASSISKETFSLFIEKSLEFLKKNGTISFVLPESILNVKAHTVIRKIILDSLKINYVEYLGDIFDGVNCPSIILNMTKTDTPFSTLGMKVSINNQQYIIDEEREVNTQYFNFHISNEEYRILKKIYSSDNKFLKNKAIFGLGIVTGNNKEYLFDSPKNENCEVILTGKNLQKYNINGPYNYIEYDMNLYQQVAPESVYRSKEKLLYKFISNELIFTYDNKQRLTLNSCNIVIPKIPNMDIKFILGILNSNISQFIFTRCFNSIKVLRSHIENLPIPNFSIDDQKKIILLVDDILQSNGNYNKLNDEINERIYDFYGLSENEINIIKNQ